MKHQLLDGEHCRWCGRNLRDSFLAEVAGAIEKNGTPLFPILCVCGGITVIGAGSFISHLDDLCEKETDHTPPKGRRPQAAKEIRAE